MKDQPRSNSGLPLIIIGAVLLAALLGGWWFYSTSKSSTTSTANRANTTNAARSPQAPVNAPPGAQPPHMLGSPTETVTLEEFADFQCGSCASVHPLLKQIQSVYGSRIKFVFRHFPLSMHDKAVDAAVITEAAGMQGKFWEMQNQLFTNQQAWATNPNYRQLFLEYAQKIGLDVTRLQTDAAGMPARSRVEADQQRGKALNVNSTPTMFINGKAIPYPQMNETSLREIIDAEIQSAGSQTKSASQTPPPSSTTTTANSNGSVNSNAK